MSDREAWRKAWEWIRRYGDQTPDALNRARGGSMTVSGPTRRQVRLVTEAIGAAHRSAEALGIRLVLILIPSRASATSGDTREAQVYDIVVAGLGSEKPSVLDLRGPFREYSKPETLYYDDDAHWNARGMALAADCIVDHLAGLTRARTSTTRMTGT